MKDRHAKPLGEHQLSDLAERLRGTSHNIYSVVSTMFDRECTDDVFESLRAKHDLSRCIECNIWKSIAKGDVCEECDIEMHGGD